MDMDTTNSTPTPAAPFTGHPERRVAARTSVPMRPGAKMRQERRETRRRLERTVSNENLANLVEDQMLKAEPMQSVEEPTPRPVEVPRPILKATPAVPKAAAPAYRGPPVMVSLLPNSCQPILTASEPAAAPTYIPRPDPHVIPPFCFDKLSDLRNPLLNQTLPRYRPHTYQMPQPCAKPTAESQALLVARARRQADVPIYRSHAEICAERQISMCIVTSPDDD
ncbi:unnamed protein product [Mycena citricolor]|uniref:Uncharacterized protein n=1 Tax=Mycena citricolor TaxID=2018698 RepID=A0AAD2H188_9AGAR|nr:unnamed protein product [Mycena citricolor]CAK5267825.1 unnamed protein product [Mycena citricolor]